MFGHLTLKYSSSASNIPSNHSRSFLAQWSGNQKKHQTFITYSNYQTLSISPELFHHFPCARFSRKLAPTLLLAVSVLFKWVFHSYENSLSRLQSLLFHSFSNWLLWLEQSPLNKGLCLRSVMEPHLSEELRELHNALPWDGRVVPQPQTPKLLPSACRSWCPCLPGRHHRRC